MSESSVNPTTYLVGKVVMAAMVLGYEVLAVRHGRTGDFCLELHPLNKAVYVEGIDVELDNPHAAWWAVAEELRIRHSGRLAELGVEL